MAQLQFGTRLGHHLGRMPFGESKSCRVSTPACAPSHIHAARPGAGRPSPARISPTATATCTVRTASACLSHPARPCSGLCSLSPKPRLRRSGAPSTKGASSLPRLSCVGFSPPSRTTPQHANTPGSSLGGTPHPRPRHRPTRRCTKWCQCTPPKATQPVVADCTPARLTLSPRDILRSAPPWRPAPTCPRSAGSGGRAADTHVAALERRRLGDVPVLALRLWCTGCDGAADWKIVVGGRFQSPC